MKKNKPERVPKDVEYENFVDSVYTFNAKNKILIYFGQNLPHQKDINWIARFWIDPSSLKSFTEGFIETLKSYEKKFGKIT